MVKKEPLGARHQQQFQPPFVAMNPEDSILLQHLGLTFLFDLSSLVGLTLIYGMLVSLTLISIAMLLRRGRPSRRFMLFVNLLAFLLGTLQWAAYLEGFVYKIRATLVELPDYPLDDSRLDAINARLFPGVVIDNWASQLLPLLSDAIIVWRALAFFPNQRWVMAAPLTLLLGGIVTSIVYLGLTSKLASTQAAQVGASAVTANLFASTIALSLATNAVATSLVSYRLWSHRKTMLKSGFQRMSNTQKVMLIVVESGVLFCIFQVVVMALMFAPYEPLSSFDLGSVTTVSIYTLFSAMYPTIIVILASRQRSSVETFGLNPALDLSTGSDGVVRPAAARSELAFQLPGSRQDEDEEAGPGSLEKVIELSERDDNVPGPDVDSEEIRAARLV
ncbi:hypothetical protein D9615_007000 [Tricholomella constricta]|uniref:Uncharacterized protein n=1 Tax=Tricholomella constricta TaxID=117010 RepID=A0A8H5M2R9_9AGAR|nr:hypothetical protein D9615_007000 [Tricholomella constricta]